MSLQFLNNKAEQLLRTAAVMEGVGNERQYSGNHKPSYIG